MEQKVNPSAETVDIRKVKCLGSGGLGETWLAERHLTSGAVRRVTIKQAAGNHGKIRLILAAGLARLESHPNLRSIEELVLVDGKLTLVLEYVQGWNLFEFWHRAANNYPGRQFPAGVVTAILMQVCDGLSHLHRNGLFMCDLKLDNVLIDQSGRVKLIDYADGAFFQALRDGEKQDTPQEFLEQYAENIGPEPGIYVGTPRFMSPEHLSAEGPTALSDIYNVSYLLHKLLTGRSVIGRMHQLSTFAQVARGPTSIQLQLIKHQHEQLGAVFERCTQRNPRDRFASAHELRCALVASAQPDMRTLEHLARSMQPDVRASEADE